MEFFISKIRETGNLENSRYPNVPTIYPTHTTIILRQRSASSPISKMKVNSLLYKLSSLKN